MTSLLPPNSTELEHAIDSMAAKQLGIDLAKVDTNAMTCDAVLLPWLAAAMRVDIDGLGIPEQRQLISNAFEIHKYKGSVYAVQKALDVVFDDAQLKEFENAFEFSADVKVKPNPNSVYTPDKFARAVELVNQAKNLRSRFKGFNVSLPDAGLSTNHHSALAIHAALSSNIKGAGKMNINITGAMQWMI